MSKKYVYFFGSKGAEGNAGMKNTLGGKGANLAEMTNLKIPVPPGFTITTEVCNDFFANNNQYPDGLWKQAEEGIAKLEADFGKKFGDTTDPLLVSVRSGARASMPGMMDTVLNLGLNDETVEGLAKKTGNERFAYDCYRRFIMMFSDVVLEIPKRDFDKVFEAKKKSIGVELDTDLCKDSLQELVLAFKGIVKERKGIDFPSDIKEQLRLSINAVFESWNNERAIKYRNMYNIPHNWGTAVNVQAMVFGNTGNNSGTGVAFTRDPSTGEKRSFGEYLINAQGEDVVAGVRTPKPIFELERDKPKIYNELVEIYQRLEAHYKDMQDMEFTIQDDKLYMLQTRNGKRTATAAINIAVDMVAEGLIDKNTAVLRVQPEQLDQVLHPMIDPKSEVTVIAKGLPASPGAAVGKIVFDAETAQKMSGAGEKVILVRQETSPEDIGGMDVSQGILTGRGGMTSHAAVVARGMGRCCVAGCSELSIDEENKILKAKGYTYGEGDYISLDGSSGRVMDGQVKLIKPKLTGNFGKLMAWADEARKLGVRTNADTPHDAAIAKEFGAEGIGLCRTEHMFFEGDRVKAVREMILADDEAGRRTALKKILPMQKGDFKAIFKVMDGLPVTIRLLDPPLHEFLPHTKKDMEEIAADMGISVDAIKEKSNQLKEFNPMLGHRGCRLGITYPEIYEIQVEAIFEAACELAKEGKVVKPEIMIPLVGHINELSYTKKNLVVVAEKVMAKHGVKVEYMVGTMIELPRAAITADQIATEAEFFSFGTNDLTQTTFGFSRDDIGSFLGDYLSKNILPIDPFVSIDQSGVGELIKMGIEKGRSVRGNLKIGICGEHGGDPASVAFCHKLGMDYVSCSPYRVPIARLAAAHVALKEKN